MTTSPLMPGPLRVDPIQEAGRQWRAHFGDAMVPSMMAVTSVMRVQQLLLARLNDALEPFELTFARYEALMLLYFSRTGSLPLGRIGSRLQVHPTSVTNLIDRLERDGLVRREPHPRDRRATLATVTEPGRRVAEEATATLHAIEFGLGGLDRPELDLIFDLLREPRIAAGDFVPGEGDAQPR